MTGSLLALTEAGNRGVIGKAREASITDATRPSIRTSMEKPDVQGQFILFNAKPTYAE